MIGKRILLFFLFILFCGFKPGPKPGMPRFTIDNTVEFRLISFCGKAVVENGIARVSVSFMFSIGDTLLALYPLSFYLRADSVELFINGDKYGYRPSQMDIIMVPSGINFFQINYFVETSYLFSGPPGELIYGEAFELSCPFVRSSLRSTPIIPEQFIFVVSVPKNYNAELPKSGWNIEKLAEKLFFISKDPNVFRAPNYWFLKFKR